MAVRDPFPWLHSPGFGTPMISVQPSAMSFAAAQVVEIPERVPGGTEPTAATLSEAETLLEVGLAMRDFTAQIGYDKFLACLYVPTARAEDSLTVLNGYPSRWLQIYTERGYVDVDPIMARQWRSSEPFEWSDLDPRGFHPRAVAMFVDAMRYGLFSGMSLHLLGRTGSHLFLNFAASRYRSLGVVRDAVFGAALLFGTRALSVSVDLIERDPNAILRRLRRASWRHCSGVRRDCRSARSATRWACPPRRSSTWCDRRRRIWARDRAKRRSCTRRRPGSCPAMSRSA